MLSHCGCILLESILLNILSKSTLILSKFYSTIWVTVGASFYSEIWVKILRDFLQCRPIFCYCCANLCYHSVNMLIIHIKVLLDCDWFISIQLIPNHSAIFCRHSSIFYNYSAIFCNHSAILCYHSAILCNHSAKFCKLKLKFSQILLCLRSLTNLLVHIISKLHSKPCYYLYLLYSFWNQFDWFTEVPFQHESHTFPCTNSRTEPEQPTRF